MTAAPSGPSPVSGKQLYGLLCLFLVALTLAVFWNVQHHDFIFYDDPGYVILNRHVQAGLTLSGVAWAFTTTEMSNWHPLTWLSLMLDHHLFRLNPAGYHWTNLIIHIASVIVLFTVLRRMTQAVWKSALVAALFAVHPLHVESVAWISERKDVLSALFWFLTIGAYVRYTQYRETGNYMLLVVTFMFGLLAKPMLVTLPFLLLLLDIWPLKRLPVPFLRSDAVPSAEGKAAWMSWSDSLKEKIPLFLLALLSSAVTYWVQSNWKAVGSLQMFSPDVRAANALISYVLYIKKMFWPADLAFFYPYVLWWSGWTVAGAGILIAGVTILVLKQGTARPYLAVGWLWYLGTLVPVIGIVQVGSQAMADRYTYIPLVGLFIMIVWGVPDLLGAWRFKRQALPVFSALMLSVLAVFSWQQVQHWRNSVTLFEHALSVTSGNYLAHNNLGVALSLSGRPEDAVRHYTAALQIKPDYADAHHNLGVILAGQGRFEEAIRHYSRAIELGSNERKVRENLEAALSEKVRQTKGRGAEEDRKQDGRSKADDGTGRD